MGCYLGNRYLQCALHLIHGPGEYREFLLTRNLFSESSEGPNRKRILRREIVTYCKNINRGNSTRHRTGFNDVYS